MSLDQAPEPTLLELRGRLETLQGAWILAADPQRRKELNEKFKALSEEIERRFGAEGGKVVNQVVAKHLRLLRRQ